MGKEQHPSRPDPSIDAALDQAAAACRDTYDNYGINIHDEQTRLTILTTMNLFAQSKTDISIPYLALARLLELT